MKDHDLYFDGFYRNESSKDYFISAYKSGRLPHAFIIEGIKGSGRKTLIKSVARMICGTDPLSEKIISDNSPDFLTYRVEDKKKFISVDTIRELKREAYLKPSELDYKFLVIEEAGMMNEKAQNALLKILEEPPLGVYIFLIAENASSLLPTIRSRAAVVRTERLTDEETAEFLMMKGYDRETSEKAARQSGSSPGRALDLLEYAGQVKTADRPGNGVITSEKTVGEIFGALRRGDFGDLISVFSDMPGDRRYFGSLLNGMRAACRDMLSAEYGHGRYVYYEDTSTALKEKGMLTEHRLLLITDVLSELEDMLEGNMNMTLVKISAAKKLMRTSKL